MPKPEAKKLEAHARMSRVAVMLAARFGPVEAAGMLIACGVTLLQRAGGLAPEYLRDLADGIERPCPADVPVIN